MDGFAHWVLRHKLLIVIFWIVGLVVHILGAFIHVFLVIAIIVVILSFIFRHT